MTAMALFMGGFLLAIGLATLVLTLFAGALIAIGVVALVAVWPELRRSLGEWIRRLRSRGHPNWTRLR